MLHSLIIDMLTSIYSLPSRIKTISLSLFIASHFAEAQSSETTEQAKQNGSAASQSSDLPSDQSIDTSITQPNVILIMTDDQGWGDFGKHGNNIIETPHLDKLAGDSVSWENFYVSPVCSPTRASLMTGRYNQRTKCLDTYLGRSMMASDEVTIAEALSGAGYATGIFGKWHLGDNYPMRPSDQGFEYSFIHKGGGLGQPSDAIENNNRYTDPILYRNNSEISTTGYCTDLFFTEAIKFISDAQISQRPFFAYIATNAPHFPSHDVPKDLLEHYKKEDITSLLPDNLKENAKQIDKVQRVAAMITNVDQNIGRLVKHLTDEKLLNNTLIIYLNDNGPNTLRYTGKFRGMKSNIYEGGIRSPLWLHWPDKFKTHKTITSNLAAHIDIMPTIMDACDLGVPEAFQFDGRSILEKSIDETVELSDRPIIIQAHRGANLVQRHNFMIRDKQWKLLHDSGFKHTRLTEPKPYELYNLSSDPGETKNLAKENPEIVEELTAKYDTWYNDVTATRVRDKGIPLIIANKEKENPLVLSWQERISKNWGIDYEGIWKLYFPTDVRADIIIYAAPGKKLKGKKLIGYTPTIQIESQVITGSTMGNEDYAIFPGVTIPKGKHNLQAMFTSGDESDIVHAYQVRIIHR